MSRIINGMPANTNAEKKAAIESMGGVYKEKVEGDYVENKRQVPAESNSNTSNQPKNYVEHLEGDYIVEGEIIEDKKSGWF